MRTHSIDLRRTAMSDAPRLRAWTRDSTMGEGITVDPRAHTRALDHCCASPRWVEHGSSNGSPGSCAQVTARPEVLAFSGTAVTST